MCNSESLDEAVVTLSTIFKQISHRRDVSMAIIAGIVSTDCPLARARYLTYVDDNDHAVTQMLQVMQRLLIAVIEENGEVVETLQHSNEERILRVLLQLNRVHRPQHYFLRLDSHIDRNVVDF